MKKITNQIVIDQLTPTNFADVLTDLQNMESKHMIRIRIKKDGRTSSSLRDLKDYVFEILKNKLSQPFSTNHRS